MQGSGHYPARDFPVVYRKYRAWLQVTTRPLTDQCLDQLGHPEDASGTASTRPSVKNSNFITEVGDEIHMKLTTCVP